MLAAKKTAQSSSSIDTVRTNLKWFNRRRGFGFVTPDNGTSDAFLHVTKLDRAGVTALGEGARMICQLERSEQGIAVTRIVEVLNAGIAPEPIRPPATSENAKEDYSLTGVVKFYNPGKGFGFVKADDGGPDVFLDARCLRDHGLSDIEKRTPVSMIVRPSAKNRKIVSFTILD